MLRGTGGLELDGGDGQNWKAAIKGDRVAYFQLWDQHDQFRIQKEQTPIFPEFAFYQDS